MIDPMCCRWERPFAMVCVLALAACSKPPAGSSGTAPMATPAPGASAAAVPALPEPRSNLALAAVHRADGVYLVAANGLGSGKSWADVRRSLWLLAPTDSAWRVLPDLPVTSGRLASVAVAVGERAYLFGGYSVAADGSETSTPEVFAIDPVRATVAPVADMPVPVDDAVALPWRDRYIVLVSGWHDHGNVAAVQILDTTTDRWQPATDFPGTPVFGHAGGLVGDDLLICDGVTARRDAQGQGVFALTDACYRGQLNPADIGHIDWQPLPAHPGRPRYRMAATGTEQDGARVVFAGGSENPYNYDGIGYDGVPSAASTAVFSFDFGRGQWQQHVPTAVASMDHRALIERDGNFHLIGGMRDPQSVSAEVVSFRLR